MTLSCLAVVAPLDPAGLTLPFDVLTVIFQHLDFELHVGGRESEAPIRSALCACLGVSSIFRHLARRSLFRKVEFCWDARVTAGSVPRFISLIQHPDGILSYIKELRVFHPPPSWTDGREATLSFNVRSQRSLLCILLEALLSAAGNTRTSLDSLELQLRTSWTMFEEDLRAVFQRVCDSRVLSKSLGITFVANLPCDLLKNTGARHLTLCKSTHNAPHQSHLTLEAEDAPSSVQTLVSDFKAPCLVSLHRVRQLRFLNTEPTSFENFLLFSTQLWNNLEGLEVSGLLNTTDALWTSIQLHRFDNLKRFCVSERIGRARSGFYRAWGGVRAVVSLLKAIKPWPASLQALVVRLEVDKKGEPLDTVVDGDDWNHLDVLLSEAAGTIPSVFVFLGATPKSAIPRDGEGSVQATDLLPLSRAHTHVHFTKDVTTDHY